MKELSKIQDLAPVSFANEYDDLTKGQKMLLKLLTDKVKKNEQIFIEDIISLYYDALNKDGWMNYYNYTNNDRMQKLSKDEFSKTYAARSKSIQWFRANLGSVIIKGKLLVVPIIEI